MGDFAWVEVTPSSEQVTDPNSNAGQRGALLRFLLLWILRKLSLQDMIARNETLIEGSLELKLPTIWTDEKQGRGREKRKIRREKSRRERVRRKKMEMREKVGKSRNTLCFSNDLWLRRVEK